VGDRTGAVGWEGRRQRVPMAGHCQSLPLPLARHTTTHTTHPSTTPNTASTRQGSTLPEACGQREGWCRTDGTVTERFTKHGSQRRPGTPQPRDLWSVHQQTAFQKQGNLLTLQLRTCKHSESTSSTVGLMVSASDGSCTACAARLCSKQPAQHDTHWPGTFSSNPFRTFALVLPKLNLHSHGHVLLSLLDRPEPCRCQAK
jgi:hypothetical protein